MTIEIDDETNGRLPLDARRTAEQVIEATLDYMDCPYEASVELLITGSDEIRTLNRENRGIDSETDVLSFPMIEFSEPGDFSGVDQDEDNFDPESGELLLGDIVICADRVLAQAEAYGHSVRREYAFLITHSMLHLLGYDHMNEEDAARMEQLQREVLESIQITRE